VIKEIEVYAENPDQILLDVSDAPEMQEFIDPKEDLESATLSQGQTAQQVLALRRSSIAAVMARILKRLQALGLQLRQLICGTGPNEFDYCAKRKKMNQYQLIVMLRNFLTNNFTLAAAAIGTLIAWLNAVIVAFIALGHVEKGIAQMCNCP
jgi:ABC-type phosphate/phosphonate transport system permease subunit